jgi:hypothetical protein
MEETLGPSPLTHLDRTCALLAEINPPVAAAVRAVGPNSGGLALPGLLGWLPDGDRLDLCRAVLLAEPDPDAYGCTAEEMADGIAEYGGWFAPTPERTDRIEAGYAAWLAARRRRPLSETNPAA